MFTEQDLPWNENFKNSTQENLRERIRNKQLREHSSIQDVARWTREWRKHIGSMKTTDCQIYGFQVGKRPQGRLPKRWRE